VTLNRTDAPAALVAFFRTLLGTPYSEGSPPGSDADGHAWVPGEGKPNHLDCSGATYYVVREVTGLDIDTGDPGNAVGQWDKALGGRLLPQTPLAPGDLLYFLGSGPPPVGHTGMCVTFNSATGDGTYISAYDTAQGLCIMPFSIRGGADGYVGAVRVANALPAAPIPPKPPKPAPSKPLTADQYAALHGFVHVDIAEANLLIKHKFAWYVFQNQRMRPVTGRAIIPRTRFGVKAQLDAAGIPHAGA
jgi:hypothetical protein